MSEDEYVMRSIKAEAALFGDILQGSFVDSYRQSRNKTRRKQRASSKSLVRNLSYKAILGHLWISSNCPEADLVVKADDDFFIDIPLLRWPHPNIMC